MICRLLIIGFLAIGCASESAHQDNRAAQNPYYISLAEIIARPDITTAYEAVLWLRPQWLNRGGSPRGGLVHPRVAVDTRLEGKIGELNNIPADLIESIRYLNSSESFSRFGFGQGSGRFYSGGVIWVKLLH